MEVITRRHVRAAAMLAELAHAGQVCKRGLPYIEHPRRLARAAQAFGPEVELVAWLHDVVEDCTEAWAHAALELAHSVGLKGALLAVTREPGESYQQSIQRAKHHPTLTEDKHRHGAHYYKVAATVKFLDVMDHIMQAATPELQSMVRTRYLTALRELVI